ncbi:MAG TPA: site-specific DNA-methyltransferase [Fimbriimonadaceae bacterium]|jgi:site-specific DNA-methyltransferase (cytosine-N4-specific)
MAAAPQLQPRHSLLPEHIIPAYQTALGTMLQGKSEEILSGDVLDALKGKVQLIFTSPPFPLNKKKKYGNLQGDAYLQWLKEFAPLFKELLTEDGSIVIELGNAWMPGEPTMSTLALKSLIEFQESAKLHLCQQFVCHNPTRLPSPIEWVNVQRIRVIDSYTNVWWLGKSSRPKADNRKVLQEYSEAMKQLLSSKKYNSGKRPSQFRVGEKSFLKDNGGSIPSNVLRMPNTTSSDEYLRYCRKEKLQLHPARMPMALPEFFIKFLTDENDVVLDPFGGSNSTGAAAEKLQRQWVSIEPDSDYIKGSRGRFPGLVEDDPVEQQ